MKNMDWLKWPLEHYSISLLIVVILLVLGIYGMYVMPKDEFPHATIRQGVVVAVYPGATSEEVEQQVARPLERYLFTYGEVNRVKTTTTSQNGMCIVMVRLNDEVNNKDEVWSKIKHGLNTFKMQLPSGVLALVVNDDFGNTSALLIAIESDQRSYRELKQYSDDLSDRLRRIPSVANVKLFGEQNEQISLYIDRQRLQAYGIGQQLLFTRLQAQGITTMSGSISDDDQQIPIHIEAMEDSERPLFVLCQGAITNVALALQTCPEIAGRMTVIWIGTHGEAPYKAHFREFNAGNDIPAANLVLRSKVDLWLVPSEVYGTVTIGIAEIKRRISVCGKIGQHLYDNLIAYNNSGEAGWTQGESWSLGDSPAIAIVLNPGCGHYKTIPAPEIASDTSSVTAADAREVRIYTDVDSRYILEDFIAKLELFSGMGVCQRTEIEEVKQRNSV